MDASDTVYSTIFNDPQHQYYVQSKVSEEVFASFIKYWTEDVIPDININNIQEYYELSSEFGLMKEIVDEKKRSMSEQEQILHSLNDPNIRDKSFLIKEISNDLDNYLIRHGPALMNQPIQTLISIFNKQEFNEHNLAYKLIKDKFDESGDLNIFILLPFIDGKRLKHEYLKESIEESSKRNNFKVNFDFSYIIELEERIEITKNEQNEQQNQINELTGYIRRLEERLSSFETQTQQNITNHEMMINNQNENNQQNFNEIQNRIRTNEESTTTQINENANEIHRMNEHIERMQNEHNEKMIEIQSRFNEMNTINEEQRESFNQHLMTFEQNKQEMKDSIKHSSESAFCHYLYHCIKNNLQFDQIYLPNYQNLYVYKPISKENPGILSYLKETTTDEFDRPFIVSLSSRDPYNLLLDDWEGSVFSLKYGDFYIEITLKDSIEMTGFEIVGAKIDLLKSYQIFIDDEKILDIEEDEEMRDNHKVRYDFEMKTCKKFKLVQTGPNWNKDKTSYIIGLKKIEFFTRDHPEGLFKYWNQQNIYKDPHLFPAKIDSNQVSTEDIHDLQSNKIIATGNLASSFCEIKFLKGVVLIDGYRLKRKGQMNKLKGWKIVGQTMSNQEITISEFVDSSNLSDQLHISQDEEIKNKEYIQSLKIYRTEKNWDGSKFLSFQHFEIFGQYILK